LPDEVRVAEAPKWQEADMSDDTPGFYVLGYSNAEHQRLVRQAKLLAPATEQLFKDAGLCPGMRVLDIGCGMGDVSMLVAHLVGPSGYVVGVDRDDTTLGKARARGDSAGYENLTFVRADIADLPRAEPFDAIVGRFIIMFLPDPVDVLKELRALVHPGGVMAFLEASWVNQLAQTAHLPLRLAVSTLVHDTLARSGARTNNELPLWRDFQSAGLPPPKMRNEVLMSADPELRSWLFDITQTLLPRAKEFGLTYEPLGDMATLKQRLDDELFSANSFATCLGVVAAHCRVS
jgi:ubiquinone/menaquinone biosynthesis C-methylase UbiE